jgi:predicted metal-binding membrane protein
LAVAQWPWTLPIAASGLGWLSVLVLSRTNGDGHLHHLLVIGAMAVAMMSPLALPVCVAATRSSLWHTSTRCVIASFAAFISIWVAAGAVLHVTTELAVGLAPAGLLFAGLAGWCAFDAVSRRRARLLAACTVSRPLLPRSPTACAADLGAASAVRCFGTCWAPMALVVTQPLLAVPISALIVLERLVTPRPRWPMAAVYGLGALWGIAMIWR